MNHGAIVFAEAQNIDAVSEIPLNRLFDYQQVALMRVLMYLTGQVHELIGDAAKEMRAVILAQADADGNLDTLRAYKVQGEVAKIWGDVVTAFNKLTLRGMEQAASLPFGVQAAYHQKLIGPVSKPSLAEAQVIDGVFASQLKAIVDAAMDVLGPDNLRFSTRIWRFDRESRSGINSAIMAAVTDQKSAWQLAQDLEQFLGAGEDCPRWTYTRLNRVSAAEKAKGDPRGFLNGEDCSGKGVSYNALRLARTEIQRAHHLANDNRMAAMPWIEQERIVLSASHPEPDECDEVANGGEDGKGIYPKGTVSLPLHPHCFCNKVAVQDLQAFGDQLGEWVRTGQGFAAMDEYKANLGMEYETNLLNNPVAARLGVWLFDQFDELTKEMQP